MQIKIINKKIAIIILIIIAIIISIWIGFNVVSASKRGTIIWDKTAKYKILIDVEESNMYIFENNKIFRIYKCSGGKTDTPSPIGTWNIATKRLWGEGFGGRWMGLNVPWGTFGIHGTSMPDKIGMNVSHGCIRLNSSEAAELYDLVTIGTQVRIIDGIYGAFGKGFRNLKSGMYGSDVLVIQKKLKALGFLKEEPNGIFGPKTEEAVKEYCKQNGLKETKKISIDLQKQMGFELVD